MSNNPNDNSQQQSSHTFSSFGSFSSFGQFGQTGNSSHWGFEQPPKATETPEPEAPKSPVVEESQTASVSSGFDMFVNSPQVEERKPPAVDSDSFLAEPSMTAAEFDSTFVKESSETAAPAMPEPEPEPTQEPEVIEPSPEPEVIEPSPEPAESISITTATTPDTIPQIVEEPEKSPQYLESPQSISVEENLADSSFPVSDLSEPVEESRSVSVEQVEEAKVVEAMEAEQPVEAAKESFIEEEQEQEAAAQEEVVVAHEQEVVAQEEEESAAQVAPAAAEVVETPKAPKNKSAVQTPKVTKAKAAPQSPTTTKSPRKAASEEAPAPAEGVRHSTRQRRTVERLDAVPVQAKDKSAHELVIPAGSGVSLGEIAPITKALNAKVAANPHLILLHRLLYDRMGEAAKRKANIRTFRGVDRDGATEAFRAKLEKYGLQDIKNVAALLCLPVSGEKSALITRVAAFLAKPSADAVSKLVAAPKKATKAAPPKPKGTNRTAALKRKKAEEAGKDSSAEKPGKKAKTAKAPAKAKAKSTGTKAASLQAKSYLTPDTVDSDVDSDVEREVLEEIQNAATA